MVTAYLEVCFEVAKRSSSAFQVYVLLVSTRNHSLPFSVSLPVKGERQRPLALLIENGQTLSVLLDRMTRLFQAMVESQLR